MFLPFQCLVINFFLSYYEKYENVWHHGEFAKVTDNGGFVIYGRSDTTLNPGGVRLGTAETVSYTHLTLPTNREV